ncbi:serine protease FAM111A-like [Phascolarctos cinereus]|uniref:Protein FAM111A-like n=1 Tax=Phascolarctos cinereus TaxID=38626 RepID=A0A6P5JC38_PHACI|nr:protein FAM111A-like [Phascolarctos cinereus]XP_020831843.1 protein FAM111A-like [Phascolarctos cinereus]
MVKQEHPLTQPPGKECPGKSTLIPSEVAKCSEQFATVHPTDDTEVEFIITMAQWRKSSSSTYKLYGKPSDSVYTALMKNEDVQDELQKRPEQKEMRVSTGGTARAYVNLGMPLKSLPKNSHLHVTFIKTEENQNDEQKYNKSTDQDCFTFCVSGKGRERKKIVKSRYCAKSDDYLCVYGFKGDTIDDALCNDGRFLSWVTENNWTLVKEGVKYPKNTPVEKVADQKFDVIVKEIKKRSSQNRHKEKVKKMTSQQNSNSEEQVDYHGTIQEVAPSVTADNKLLKLEMAEGDRKPVPSGSKPKKSNVYFIEKSILKIYNFFEEEKKWITNFFEKEINITGKSGNELFNLHLEEFSKVTEDAMTSKTFKTLVPLVDSIGYIHLTKNGGFVSGTCFVFWDRYILTCRHVLNKIIGEVEEQKWAQTISENSFVTFTDENPKDSSKKIGIEPWFEVESKTFDYAVLKLKGNEIPKSLFKQKQNTKLPCDGIVFIIGHPEGAVKKIDICTVISLADRVKKCRTVLQNRQKLECNPTNCPHKEKICIHMFSMKGFQDQAMNSQDHLTYDTSFFCGSSGSPILDASGRLVAMHAGGFKYDFQGQKQSVIEFGISINSIHNDMRQNHESWYNSLFPYQQDVEMVNADDLTTKSQIQGRCLWG